jgi:hypothetical protein
MHANPQNATPSIRELMPQGFLRTLLLRTGCKQRATISDVVLLEQTTSKYWPAIETLAKETKPEGFAQWEASRLTQAA